MKRRAGKISITIDNTECAERHFQFYLYHTTCFADLWTQVRSLGPVMKNLSVIWTQQMLASQQPSSFMMTNWLPLYNHTKLHKWFHTLFYIIWLLHYHWSYDLATGQKCVWYYYYWLPPIWWRRLFFKCCSSNIGSGRILTGSTKSTGYPDWSRSGAPLLKSSAVAAWLGYWPAGRKTVTHQDKLTAYMGLGKVGMSFLLIC